MSIRRVWPLVSVALLLAAAAAAPAAIPSLINPGAVLDVSVFAGGEKQMDFTATVTPDSLITVPMAGDVRVGGLTVTDASDLLKRRLARGYFVKPQVLINVRDYGGKVFVSGEVKSPGMYSLGQGLTAWNAVVLAGGLSDFAAAGRARIVRTMGRSKPLVLRVDLGKVRKGEAADPMLRDGDRVEVPRRLF